MVLPLEKSSSTSTLREDLRVSLFQRLGVVELGGIIEADEDAGLCTEPSPRRTTGTGIVG